jgi:RNA polymerase sigma factor for flagellar operon FliA
MMGASYESHGRASDGEIVRKYGHLVERMARQISAKVGSDSAKDDLWSVGALGLVDAARRFDAARGIKFETFAQHRIRGAMLDELRQMDHLPRRLRTAAEKVADQRRKLSTELGREPASDEVAKALDMTIEELQELETVSQPLLAFDAPEVSSALEPLAGDEPTPMEVAMKRQLGVQLAAAVECLTERQRQVVALYYVEGLIYREIAKVLGVSEPRVCQIHGDAMKALRGRLQEGDAAAA